jgi:tetraacyldisaccharide 4'-kinase
VIAARHPFADHYPFDDREIRDLLAEAEKLRAIPVTTRKDIVRIPPALRTGIQVVSIALAWDDPTEIEALLDRVLASQA